MPLPWMQRSPASITSHLELSTMIGTRAMSGSLAIRLQEAHHRGLAVEHGLVHVDVDDLRAVLDLLARHGQRLLELAVQDHAGEHLRARDVGALADVDEQRPFADRHRLEAGQLHGGNVEAESSDMALTCESGQASVVAGKSPRA